MRRPLAAVFALATLGWEAGAWAQVIDPNTQIPWTPQAAYAAAPYGAHYYPGVGFRYVLPPSERIYGYYAGPRVYGYRARYRPCARGWWWESCGRARW